MRAPQPVSRLAVALDLPAERVPVGTLAWAEDKRLSAFQYDPRSGHGIWRFHPSGCRRGRVFYSVAGAV